MIKGLDTPIGFIPNYAVFATILFLVVALMLYVFYRLGGFRELKKIWLDVNLNPGTGKYSQKRLAMTGSIFLGWIVCFSQVFTIKIYPDIEFNTKDVDIFVPILLFTIGGFSSIATQVGKLQARKTADENGNPLAPPFEEPLN